MTPGDFTEDQKSWFLRNQAAKEPQIEAPQGGEVPNVPMVLSDGSVKTLPLNDAYLARQLGAREATPEEIAFQSEVDKTKKSLEADGFLGSAAAASAGFFTEAVPFGALMLKKASEYAGLPGDVASARLKAMRDSTAGQLGAFASYATPTPVAKLAGFAGKAAGKLAPFASHLAEGAVYGANIQANEDTIENIPLAAERLVHGAVMGGVMQGMFAIPLGLASKGLARLKVPKDLEVPGMPDKVLEIPDKAKRDAAERLGVEFGYDLQPGNLPGQTTGGKGLRSTLAGLSNGMSERDVQATILENQGLGPTRRYQFKNQETILDKLSTGYQKLMNIFSENEKEALSHLKSPKLEYFKKFGDGTVPEAGAQQAVDFARSKYDELLAMIDAHIDQPVRWETRDGKHYQVKVPDSDLTKILKDVRKDLVSQLAPAFKAADNTLNASEKAYQFDLIRQGFGHAEGWLNGKKVAANAQGLGREAGIVENLQRWTQNLYEGELMPMQRDARFFGEPLANAMNDIYAPAHNLIQAKKILNETGLLKREPRWDEPAEFNDSLASVVKNWGRPEFAAKQKALQSYVNNQMALTESLKNHWDPWKGHYPGGQKYLDAASVLDTLEQQIEKTNYVKNLNFGNGANLIEGALRWGSGAVSTALALGTGINPYLAGSAGYAFGNIAANLVNPRKHMESKAAIEAMLRSHDVKMFQAAKNVVAGKRVPTPQIVTKDNYNKFTDSLQRAVINQAMVGKALEASIGGLSQAFPKLTTAAMVKSQQALDLMNKSLPVQTTQSNALQPQYDAQHPPGAMQLAQLNRRVAVMQNPVHFANNPTLEGLDVMQQLWPQELADYQHKMTQVLAETKGRIPFNVRQKIAMTFGLTPDSLRLPQNYANIQMSLAAAPNTVVPKSGKPLNNTKDLIPMTSRLEAK